MISKRLKAVADYVSKNDKIIDVGCDHALLDIYLSKTHNFSKIYISDISKGAISQGINNIEKNNLKNKIIALFGNGLETADEIDVDTLIISGMGTLTILDIIKNNNFNKIKKCIFQSNNNHYLLRKTMILKGFNLTCESVIYDGRYYITMLFEKGTSFLNKINMMFGIHNNKEYYKYLLNNEREILKKISWYKFSKRKIHLTNIKMLKSKI